MAKIRRLIEKMPKGASSLYLRNFQLEGKRSGSIITLKSEALQKKSLTANASTCALMRKYPGGILKTEKSYKKYQHYILWGNLAVDVKTAKRSVVVFCGVFEGVGETTSVQQIVGHEIQSLKKGGFKQASQTWL